METIFSKIIRKEVSADILYEDESVLAFRDIHPIAPVHVLVIPRAHHANAAELAGADPALAGRLLEVAGLVAAQEDVAESGYRIVSNTGSAAGQSVPHVHLHVLGGRDLAWPPG